MNRQLLHEEYEHKYKKHNLTVVLDNLEHMENIGSAFRLGDAFCVSKIIILDDKQVFLASNAKKNYKKIDKTARNCMNYVDYKIMSTAQFLELSKAEKLNLLALEITTDSQLIEQVYFNNYDNLTLIIGNEKSGVQEMLLNKIVASVHIAMFGNNSSLNVANALAIALYKISNDLKN
ncbi:MAG: TrmH family RNA methyltransferase [Clostridia bacterium]|nr:TrmH family RNA methyltransferase [Clostridia bacterium]